MTRNRSLALLAAASIGIAACGADGGGQAATPGTAGGAAPTEDAIFRANAAGDPKTEAAIRAVADHSCPATASTVGRAGAGPAPGAKLKVVTTVAPITSIVANVAGDAAEVVGVVPEGTNSHTYEPRPSVAATLSTADVVLINGLGLEEPTKRLAAANLRPQAQLVELGDATISPEQHIFDFSFPRDGGKPNPHLWTNPPFAACYATIAASVLGKADPANAATYQRNAQAYGARMADLDARFRRASETVPPRQRALLTYHDAYAYFAARYRWRVIGAIQVSDFEDPTPKEVAELIGQVRAEGVPAIFGSEVFPSPVLEQVGKEAKVRYVDVLRDDDLPGEPGSPEHTFLGLLRFDFVTMVEALGGDAAELKAFDVADVVPDRAAYAS